MIHRELFTNVSFSRHPENEIIRHCHSFLSKCDQTVLEELRKESIQELAALTGERFPDSYVLFDVPRVDKESDALPVLYVKDPHSKSGVVRLSEISQVIGAVSRDFEMSAKKSRVFVHPHLRQMLRNKNAEGKAAKIVESKISSRAQ